jgi:uncharacterized membrane protein
MSQQKIEKAEYVISLILRWGVLLCALIIACGWVMSFAQGHGLDTVHQAMTGKESLVVAVPRSVHEFWQALIVFDSQAYIALGLMFLILLPVTRVAAAAVIFFHEKDYLFVLMSLIVFSVLVLSLAMGKVT